MKNLRLILLISVSLNILACNNGRPKKKLKLNLFGCISEISDNEKNNLKVVKGLFGNYIAPGDKFKLIKKSSYTNFLSLFSLENLFYTKYKLIQKIKKNDNSTNYIIEQNLAKYYMNKNKTNTKIDNLNEKVSLSKTTIQNGTCYNMPKEFYENIMNSSPYNNSSSYNNTTDTAESIEKEVENKCQKCLTNYKSKFSKIKKKQITNKETTRIKKYPLGKPYETSSLKNLKKERSDDIYAQRQKELIINSLKEVELDIQKLLQVFNCQNKDTPEKFRVLLYVRMIGDIISEIYNPNIADLKHNKFLFKISILLWKLKNLNNSDNIDIKSILKLKHELKGKKINVNRLEFKEFLFKKIQSSLNSTIYNSMEFCFLEDLVLPTQLRAEEMLVKMKNFSKINFEYLPPNTKNDVFMEILSATEDILDDYLRSKIKDSDKYNFYRLGLYFLREKYINYRLDLNIENLNKDIINKVKEKFKKDTNHLITEKKLNESLKSKNVQDYIKSNIYNIIYIGLHFLSIS